MSSFNSTMHVLIWLKGILPILCNEVGQVPSFTKLAKLKPCGVCTIRKAMKQLEGEGYVASKHGYGTFLLSHHQGNITSPNQLTLNESPDQIKSAFKIQRQKIALLIPITVSNIDLHQSVIQYLSFITSGATQASNENNCELTIHFYEQTKGSSEKTLNEFIRYIKSNNCSAVLVASIADEYVINKIAATGIPGIIIDHWAPTSTNWLSILPHHFQAFQDMVLVLVQLQHKRIALIDREETSLNPEILKGYQSGLNKAGLEYDEKLVFNTTNGRESFNRMFKKIIKLLKSKNPPTAFISQTQYNVPNLIHSLTIKGYNVPKDISILTLGPKMDLVKHLNFAGYKVDWQGIGYNAIIRAQEILKKKKATSGIEYFKLDFVGGDTIAFHNKTMP
ncbi:MAG: hypothetical protein COA79_08560 [Planctomycetota bacterium]|nr:MAG: hypothetical protein COA79_08560 [Planctomycetota bacterium]